MFVRRAPEPTRNSVKGADVDALPYARLVSNEAAQSDVQSLSQRIGKRGEQHAGRLIAVASTLDAVELQARVRGVDLQVVRGGLRLLLLRGWQAGNAVNEGVCKDEVHGNRNLSRASTARRRLGEPFAARSRDQ
ncbi:MAG: hypothetical protein EA383_00140 [Spirochaetaceae bacterium]|nr:MAG: hypothetical protein EA383_00140 [Spirochaetaceae bacterium]